MKRTADEQNNSEEEIGAIDDNYLAIRKQDSIQNNKGIMQICKKEIWNQGEKREKINIHPMSRLREREKSEERYPNITGRSEECLKEQKFKEINKCVNKLKFQNKCSELNLEMNELCLDESRINPLKLLEKLQEIPKDEEHISIIKSLLKMTLEGMEGRNIDSVGGKNDEARLFFQSLSKKNIQEQFSEQSRTPKNMQIAPLKSFFQNLSHLSVNSSNENSLSDLRNTHSKHEKIEYPQIDSKNKEGKPFVENIKTHPKVQSPKKKIPVNTNEFTKAILSETSNRRLIRSLTPKDELDERFSGQGKSEPLVHTKATIQKSRESLPEHSKSYTERKYRERHDLKLSSNSLGNFLMKKESNSILEVKTRPLSSFVKELNNKIKEKDGNCLDKKEEKIIERKEVKFIETKEANSLDNDWKAEEIEKFSEKSFLKRPARFRELLNRGPETLKSLQKTREHGNRHVRSLHHMTNVQKRGKTEDAKGRPAWRY